MQIELRSRKTGRVRRLLTVDLAASSEIMSDGGRIVIVAPDWNNDTNHYVVSLSRAEAEALVIRTDLKPLPASLIREEARQAGLRDLGIDPD